MKKSDIARIRLYNQQITSTKFTKPAEIVTFFGGMQAQDYPMAKWAIGLRLPDSTEQKVEQAIEDGEVLRTHLMRPTWHFVAAEDIRWMLKLTAPQIKSASASMFRQLELDRDICQKSNQIITKSLAGEKYLTRQELVSNLENAGIKTNDFRAAYLIMNAELDGIICNGKRRDKHQTYALLDERVQNNTELSREESIFELTKRYFFSHAPATLKDFIWWSGLPASEAKKGLEMNKSNLISEEIEGQIYWMPDSISLPKDEPDSVHLLPAFDEFMVSYKDRSASLEPNLAKSAITGNGIFKPIIVVDGKVLGVWKRSFKKDSVMIEKILFDELGDSISQKIQSKANEYALFENKLLA